MPHSRQGEGKKHMRGGHTAPYTGALSLSLRKEVIQPHLPVRLPCYDFTPLTEHAFDGGPSRELSYRLRASPTRMV